MVAVPRPGVGFAMCPMTVSTRRQFLLGDLPRSYPVQGVRYWLSTSSLVARAGLGLRPPVSGLRRRTGNRRSGCTVVHRPFGTTAQAWPPAPVSQPTTQDRQSAARAAQLSTDPLALRPGLASGPGFEPTARDRQSADGAARLSTGLLALRPGFGLRPPFPSLRHGTDSGRLARVGCPQGRWLSTGSVPWAGLSVVSGSVVRGGRRPSLTAGSGSRRPRGVRLRRPMVC
jgi:hypothetical protein